MVTNKKKNYIAVLAPADSIFTHVPVINTADNVAYFGQGRLHIFNCGFSILH